jgi:hypothetical protein
MSASMREPVDAAHRSRVLRALGVTPWVRRVAAQAAASTDVMNSSHAIDQHGVPCVVVLPRGCAPRELDLVGRALNACGTTLARAARVMVDAGKLDGDVPQARAYLVFGEAQAHALGRALPAATMNHAKIVLADEPASVLTSAAAKRRLWQALRQLRRALATTEH